MWEDKARCSVCRELVSSFASVHSLLTQFVFVGSHTLYIKTFQHRVPDGVTTIQSSQISMEVLRSIFSGQQEPRQVSRRSRGSWEGLEEADENQDPFSHLTHGWCFGLETVCADCRPTLYFR